MMCTDAPPLETSRLTTSALSFRTNNGKLRCGRLQVVEGAAVGLSPGSVCGPSLSMVPPRLMATLALARASLSVLASVCVQVRPINSGHKACLFGSQLHFIPRNISSARAGRGGGEEVHMSRQEHTGFK